MLMIIFAFMSMVGTQQSDDQISLIQNVETGVSNLTSRPEPCPGFDSPQFPYDARRVLPQAQTRGVQSRTEHDMEFQLHFRSFHEDIVAVSVNHNGCFGTPYRHGDAQCWYSKITYGPTGASDHDVYVPNGWVIYSDYWWAIIKDGLALIYDVAMLFVPGPQPSPHMPPIKDPPKDPGEGLQDMLGIFGDVMGLGQDVLDAIEAMEPLWNQEQYDLFIETAQGAIPQAAAAMGLTEDDVYIIANDMALGSSWALVSGEAFVKFIRNGNEETNHGHGWQIFRSNTHGATCKDYLRRLKAVFIHQGHLIIPASMDENNDRIVKAFWEGEPECN